jgi:PmbA protein
MIGRDKVFSTLERVLASSKADAAEAVLLAGTSNTTRYANSTIHQNISVDYARVSLRVAIGGRTGTATCTSFAGPDLRRALRAAMDIAKKQKPSQDFPGFAPPAEFTPLSTWDRGTADLTPRQRAKKLGRVFAKGARYEYGMAGAFNAREGEIAVVNTLGVRCYQTTTSASLTCIATGPDSSGYAAGASKAVADIDAGAIAARAVEKCRKSRAPKEMGPGVYEVILEPGATAEILTWLSQIAFGSRSMQDGSSFLAGRIGQKVMGDNVTIIDDAFDPACPGIAFDFEGTPRQRIPLIEGGIARGIVHNRLSARKAGVSSTGHALPPEAASEGSLPMYLHLGAGTDTLESMIGQVENGLLITRFHYLNGLLDPRRALMTGMTRDGLMRIRKGKLAGGVKNLRFTDSMTDVFSRVAGISAERFVTVPWGDDLGSAMYLPIIRVKGLTFTGATEF